jgi:hypothetical protein
MNINTRKNYAKREEFQDEDWSEVPCVTDIRVG